MFVRDAVGVVTFRRKCERGQVMSFRAKLGRWMIGVLYIIGTVALLLMMLIVVGNSLGRVFFNTPIKLTIEGAGLLGVIIIAVALGIAERERINIMVRIIFDRFTGRTKAVVESFTLLLCLAGAAYFFWATLQGALYSLGIEERTVASRIPLTPFRFAWAAGILILCFFLALHLIEDIIKAVKK
jgi:TRAP-type C4-dicarboxylate transport system permease small subunit